MNKFREHWNHYNLSIDTSKDVIHLSWKDVESLAFYCTLQAGQFGKPSNLFSKQLFFENFSTFYQKLWTLTESLGAFDIPNDSVILDIGSGVGVMDLILAKFMPNSTIYLLDKEELNLKKDVYYDNDYFFYHNWDPVNDAITSSEINLDQIKIISPDDEWPKQIDCITSYFSWCMHYPKETYWQKVVDCLKPGGKLLLDVRNLNDRDVVSEISKEFKSNPKMHEFKATVNTDIDNYGNDILGWRCVWTKK